jgi:acyl-coenzyme A thioesterase PaaI-like protein
MIRKIKNPFDQTKPENYNCFGCSPHNKIGLQLQFFEEDDEVFSTWEPQRYLEGYPGVVHGGIQSLLLDEIGGWTVYIKCKTAGVTTKMEVEYHHPLRIERGDITVRGKLMEQQGRTAKIKALLFDGTGKLCTEAMVTYFIYPEKIARKRFFYPGVEAFFE